MMRRPTNVEVWFERERVTDDVWQAVFLEKTQKPRAPRHTEEVFETGRAKKYAVSLTVLLFMMLTVAAMNGQQTIAFFHDIERSLANAIDAGLLDFSVSAEHYGGTITPGEGGGMPIDPEVSVVGGSFDLEYTVKAEKIAGDKPFCDAIIASSAGDLAINKPLLSVDEGPTTSTAIWNLMLTLPDPAPIDVTDGMTCSVDLVYSGRIDGLSAVLGYTDEERVHIVMTANIPGKTALSEPVQLLTLPQEELPQDEAQSEVPSEDAVDVTIVEEEVLQEGPAEEVVEEAQGSQEGQQVEGGTTIQIENIETITTEETVIESTGEQVVAPEPVGELPPEE